jgi:hypothetical protein
MGKICLQPKVWTCLVGNVMYNNNCHVFTFLLEKWMMDMMRLYIDLYQGTFDRILREPGRGILSIFCKDELTT